MTKKTFFDIFNYDFNWQETSKKEFKKVLKDECCEKYKKKGEKKCKKCPKRVA